MGFPYLHFHFPLFIFLFLELFRISVSNSLLSHVQETLNQGITLRSYWSRSGKTLGSEKYHLLAVLIKTFCNELKEPAFTEDTSKKIIAVEESSAEDEKKLIYFQKVFRNLPTVRDSFDKQQISVCLKYYVFLA